MFLLEMETSASEWLTEKANFEAYNFGPFSADVYRAVDMLSAAAIISDTGELGSNAEDTWEQRSVIGDAPPTNDPYATRDFRLTDRGWRYYSAVLADLPQGAIDEVRSLKQRFGYLPLRQLVRYVYQRYPRYTENSVIRDDILGPGSDAG